METEHWAHTCNGDEKDLSLAPKLTVECKIIIGVRLSGPPIGVMMYFDLPVRVFM